MTIWTYPREGSEGVHAPPGRQKVSQTEPSLLDIDSWVVGNFEDFAGDVEFHEGEYIVNAFYHL